MSLSLQLSISEKMNAEFSAAASLPAAVVSAAAAVVVFVSDEPLQPATEPTAMTAANASATCLFFMSFPPSYITYDCFIISSLSTQAEL